jgi:hypothetical protein
MKSPLKPATIGFAVALIPLAIYAAKEGHTSASVAIIIFSICAIVLVVAIRKPRRALSLSPLTVKSFTFTFLVQGGLTSGGDALSLVGVAKNPQTLNSWTSSDTEIVSATYTTTSNLTQFIERMRDGSVFLHLDGTESNVALAKLTLTASVEYFTTNLDSRTRFVQAELNCAEDECVVTSTRPLSLSMLADALEQQLANDEALIEAGGDPWAQLDIQ